MLPKLHSNLGLYWRQIDGIIDELMGSLPLCQVFEVVTFSGSVYFIDTKNKTWRRLRADGAAQLRSDGGTYMAIFVRQAGGLVLICPPMTPGYLFRKIETTQVLLVREVGSPTGDLD